MVDTDIEEKNIIKWNALNGNDSHSIEMLNWFYARFYWYISIFPRTSNMSNQMSTFLVGLDFRVWNHLLAPICCWYSKRTENKLWYNELNISYKIQMFVSINKFWLIIKQNTKIPDIINNMHIQNLRNSL